MTNKLFIIAALISILATSACNKKDNDDNYITVEEQYFNVDGVLAQNGTFYSNVDEADTFKVSIVKDKTFDYIEPGTSRTLTLKVEKKITKVYVGCNKTNYHYLLDYTSEPKAPTEEFKFKLNFAKQDILASDYFYIKIGLYDEDEKLDVRTLKAILTDAETDTMSIKLTWTDSVDLDLYLVEPGRDTGVNNFEFDTISYNQTVSKYGGIFTQAGYQSCISLTDDTVFKETIEYDEEYSIIYDDGNSANQYKVFVEMYDMCFFDPLDSLSYTLTIEKGNVVLFDSTYDVLADELWKKDRTKPVHEFLPSK